MLQSPISFDSSLASVINRKITDKFAYSYRANKLGSIDKADTIFRFEFKRFQPVCS